MDKSRHWTVPGPLNRFGNSSVMERGARTWMTQPRPWITPLPYRYSVGKFTNLLNTSEYTYDPVSILGNMDELLDNKYAKKARNVAYADFISKLKPAQAQMLTTYAERRKTWGMITQRAVALTAGLIAIKTGNVHALKQAWGRHAKVRTNLRKAGSHVLEYSFGWAPLVSDLSAAVEVVANGVPPVRITGRAKSPTQVAEWVPTQMAYYRGGFQNTDSWDARMGATIRMNNPNLALANQLGLLNPVATLWELTPWSFVVDYVVNIGEFISSFTDFAGLELTDEYTTTSYKRTVSGSIIYAYDDPKYWGFTTLYGYSGEVLHIKRETSIAKPVLATRPRVGMPIQRAATSIALLLQQLKTK